MLRLFWAIELPEDLRRKLGKVKEKVKFKSAKWVEPENIHLTLKFLGSTPEEKLEEIKREVKKICQNYHSFEISLSTFGAFPSSKRARVFWVGISDGAKEVTHLADKIEESMGKLGFKEENKPYHPHITLARFKLLERVSLDELKLMTQELKGRKFKIKEITLFQSQLTSKGPIYTALSKVALK